MNRKECEDKKTLEYLDKVNNKRLEDARKRVAHAIRILKPVAWCTYETDKQKNELKTGIAHATNLLETTTEEMNFHCEWFDYDTAVILQVNDACSKLGMAMAEMFEAEYDIAMVTADVEDALALLAKALATLVRWNDEDQDVSEI